jgi:hypothetical protein
MDPEIHVDEAQPQKKKGLVCQPDDFNVGDTYCVLGLKRSKRPIPIAGQAFKITAINFPFIVVDLATVQPHPPVTIDTRFVNLMKVDRSFALAQIGEDATQQDQGQNPIHQLFRQHEHQQQQRRRNF